MKRLAYVGLLFFAGISCKDNPSIHSTDYRVYNDSLSKQKKESTAVEIGCDIHEGEWEVRMSDGNIAIETKESSEHSHEDSHDHKDLNSIVKDLSLQNLKWHALHEDKTKLDGMWQADLSQAVHERAKVFKSKWTVQSMRLDINSKDHRLAWGTLFLNPFTKKHAWCLANAEVDIETVKEAKDQFHIHILEDTKGAVKNKNDSKSKDESPQDEHKHQH